MRLKSEMHAIIGVCAAAAFGVIGGTAWLGVRGFHRAEVEAQGETMGLFLAKACALAIRGESPQKDLEALLRVRRGDQDPPVKSAVFYDRDLQHVLARFGAEADETLGVEETRRLEEAFEAEPGHVQVSDTGRYGTRGEPLLEFTLPVVDDRQTAAEPVRLGVLRLTLELKSASSIGWTTLQVVAGAAVVGALLWLLLFRLMNGRILDPILLLTQAIARVRGGDLTARVEIPRRDELGLLAESFNDLIGVLVERDSLAARLEEANKLAEAHRSLAEAHKQLKQRDEQLVTAEAHAKVGRLVHGLNHELNNPLSAAKNMIPPLEAAISELRATLLPPPPPAPVDPAPGPAPAPAAPAAEAPSGGLAGMSARLRGLVPALVSSVPAATPAAPRGDSPGRLPAAAEPAAAPGPAAASGSAVASLPGVAAPGPTASEPAAAEGAEAKPAASASSSALAPSAAPTPAAPAPVPPPPALMLPQAARESLDDAREAVAVIARSVARAINIVHDLGNFAKLGAADLATVELRAVIDDAVAACARELGPADRVQVQVDIPEVDGAPMRIKAFPNLLLQVFVNLITNSAQAIEGAGRVKITARLFPEKVQNPDKVRLEVEDTGCGIPKENLSKVFEPFFTTKEQGRGTGLGLSLCQSMVEKHGGTIEAVRRRRGALFVVVLPRDPVLDARDPRGSASLFAGGASTVMLTR